MASISRTFTQNATTRIIVGDATTDVSLILNYIGRRGSYSCIGRIIISCPYTDYIETTPYNRFDSDDIGISFTADINGTDIRLIGVVNDILPHDVQFDYNIEVITNDKIISPPMGIPSGLAGICVALTQINLTWLLSSTNEQSVKIERSENGGVDYAEVHSAAAGTLAWNDTTVVGLTHYYYRIRTLKDGVYSDYCSVLDIWTAITPVLQTVTVENAQQTKVVLTYDYALDETSTPATGAFTLTGKTISSVLVSGTTVTLTVSVAFVYEDVYTLSYTPGANPIRSAAGNLNAASFTNHAITNNVLYLFSFTRLYTGTQKTVKVTIGVSAGLDVTLTVYSGDVRFYDDKDGTVNEGTVRTITGGTNLIMYIKKANTGTSAYISCSDITRVTYITTADSTGTGSFMGAIGGNLDQIINLVYFSISGSNASFSGTVTRLTQLQYINDASLFTTYTLNVTACTLLYNVYLSGASKYLTGDFSNKPITYIYAVCNGDWTGDLGTWSRLVTISITMTGQNTVYGSISGLQSANFTITGNNTISSALSGLHITCSNFILAGKNRVVDYVSPHTWAATMYSITFTPDTGYGLSSSEIDNLLIDLANSNWAGAKTITLTGGNAARTSASDAAYTHLTVTHGVTITLNS